MSPVSTLPDPISTKRVTPASANHITDSRQRTVPQTCRTRPSRISAAVVTGRAVTLATTGTAGSIQRAAESACAMASAAGRISEEWNGAETGKRTARLTPRRLAMSIARAMAAAVPDRTTWPPPLSLATSQTSPSDASAAISAAVAASTPIKAAMAPEPTGTAACMAEPRSLRSRAASTIENVPAAARAEYSPSE